MISPKQNETFDLGTNNFKHLIEQWVNLYCFCPSWRKEFYLSFHGTIISHSFPSSLHKASHDQQDAQHLGHVQAEVGGGGAAVPPSPHLPP